MSRDPVKGTSWHRVKIQISLPTCNFAGQRQGDMQPGKPSTIRESNQVSVVHIKGVLCVVLCITRKSITCYYMLYKGVATCYLNLLVISSCCFDTNSEMFLMIHLYQIAQLTTNGYYIFKQLSESMAQIMSQKMFLKTP